MNQADIRGLVARMMDAYAGIVVGKAPGASTPGATTPAACTPN